MPVIASLVRALRDLTHPRVVAVMFLPMLGAIVVWVGLAWYFWGTWTDSAAALFSDSAFARGMAARGLMWMIEGLAVLGVVALVIAAIVATAVLVTEIVVMPVILSVVERQYPWLEKERSTTVIGSIVNAAAALSVFAVLWIVTLPLWLTGVGAVILPALLSAYLNQRLFRYDALAEHASREEYTAVVRAAKGRLYALGLLLAPLYYVPLVNLAAPALAGLAFTHLCLTELGRLRKR